MLGLIDPCVIDERDTSIIDGRWSRSMDWSMDRWSKIMRTSEGHIMHDNVGYIRIHVDLVIWKQGYLTICKKITFTSVILTGIILICQNNHTYLIVLINQLVDDVISWFHHNLLYLVFIITSYIILTNSSYNMTHDQYKFKI